MTHATHLSTSIIEAGAAMPLLGGPAEVISHPGMNLARKREILARWASDAHAVENAPSLRQLDDGSVVEVDAILGALRALDEPDGNAVTASAGWRAYARKRRGALLSRLRTARRRRDDDEDPPPCPASAAIPVGITITHALAA